MRVAGLAGPQVDGRAGLGPAGRAVVGRAVVVDLGPPVVRGDHPRGGAPLLQRVRRLHALLDLLARRAVGLHQALACRTRTRGVRFIQ